MQKSDLPFGSEFSPSQIELAGLFELAHTHNCELLNRLGSGEHNTNADKVMRTSNLCIVMLDGTDLDVISADPIHIKQIFRRETQRARRLRRLDI